MNIIKISNWIGNWTNLFFAQIRFFVHVKLFAFNCCYVLHDRGKADINKVQCIYRCSTVTWWVNMVLIFCHNFPHPSIKSLLVITANTMHLALTSAPLWDIQTARFYSCFPFFSLSLSPSLLFFLPPKAWPFLMFPWEQRGELANHSSLVFTLWTVNVTHNQIVLCLQPFNETCWFDIYVSVTLTLTAEVIREKPERLLQMVSWSCWSSWRKAAAQILIRKIFIKTLLILSCSQPDYVLTLKPQTIC